MAPTFKVRKSEDRGYANLGWLRTHHTFSFGDYEDPAFDGFGTLRVLNEDVVEPGKGFGTHRHREYEIFSYVVSGALEHKDSKGNHEIIRRGDVQFTTAGSGLAHSEFNASTTEPVHFLQVWNLPSNTQLPPGYETGHYPDSSKKNRFATLVAPAKKRDRVDPGHPDVGKPVAIHSEFWMSAALLDPGVEVVYKTTHVGEGKKGQSHPRRLYVHVVQNNPKVKVTVTSNEAADEAPEITLSEGDGVFVEGFDGQGPGLVVRNDGQGVAEVVLMDLS
ncbi:Pirin-domain-containing protein [Gonapodya prolifera JEL478]|uniref:Pirin-domain-containing protein n=1 Tax=Gonapodya prolifera (strain JEL478) TaxID=1344416 RepID=A0A139AX50_GONPJ|nr:Pirin-domain-containing protein [Gonapodya prolifera JEL478]|eukprot:KXS21045.1 Pirin-domain-containing protein [Gonapodya prolifera JEL478]